MMRARMPDLDEAVAADIAEEMGRLPLALEQAAAYLARNRSTISPGRSPAESTSTSRSTPARP